MFVEPVDTTILDEVDSQLGVTPCKGSGAQRDVSFFHSTPHGRRQATPMRTPPRETSVISTQVNTFWDRQ